MYKIYQLPNCKKTIYFFTADMVRIKYIHYQTVKKLYIFLQQTPNIFIPTHADGQDANTVAPQKLKAERNSYNNWWINVVTAKPCKVCTLSSWQISIACVKQSLHTLFMANFNCLCQTKFAHSLHGKFQLLVSNKVCTLSAWQISTACVQLNAKTKFQTTVICTWGKGWLMLLLLLLLHLLLLLVVWVGSIPGSSHFGRGSVWGQSSIFLGSLLHGLFFRFRLCG